MFGLFKKKDKVEVTEPETETKDADE